MRLSIRLSKLRGRSGTDHDVHGGVKNALEVRGSNAGKPRQSRRRFRSIQISQVQKGRFDYARRTGWSEFTNLQLGIRYYQLFLGPENPTLCPPQKWPINITPVWW